MSKELKGKMNKVINYYITKDKINRNRDEVINDMANSYLAYQELKKTFNVKKKEIDEELEKVLDEIIEARFVE